MGEVMVTESAEFLLFKLSSWLSYCCANDIVIISSLSSQLFSLQVIFLHIQLALPTDAILIVQFNLAVEYKNILNSPVA